MVMFIEAPVEYEGWRIGSYTPNILGFLFAGIQVIDQV